MCSCEGKLEEEGRKVSRPSSLGGSPHSNVAVSRTHNTTHVLPQCTSDHQSSPDPLPGDHTHGACVCAAQTAAAAERTRERERPTDRTAPGWAGQSRSRYRAQACAAGSSYVRVYYMHAALPPVARGPCTHARVRLVILHTRRPTDKTVFLL